MVGQQHFERLIAPCGSSGCRVRVACGLQVHIGVTDIEYLLTRYAQLLKHRVNRVRIGFGDGLRRLSDAQLHRISEKSVDERTGNGIGFKGSAIKIEVEGASEQESGAKIMEFLEGLTD